MNRIDRATKRAMRLREQSERARARRPAAPHDAMLAQDRLIERLTRVHCAPYVRKDWNAIARTGMKGPPPRINTRETAARKALARHEPGVIESLFGLGKARRRDLAAKVIAAAKADLADHDRARRTVDAHNIDVQAAAGVLALDLNAIEATLKANIDREAIGAALEGFALMQAAPGRFVVFVDGLEAHALPDETCVALESGELGYRPSPPTAIHELHLSNVCSAALRVGLEVLGAIGVEGLEVLVRCHLPHADGGETEQYPVLYIRLTHAALERMDFRRLEPVSTVTALGGRLDWDISRGFAGIGIDDLKLYPQPARQVVAG